MSATFFDVTATPLPDDSLLHAKLRPGDFLDCYRIQSDVPTRQAAEVITNFPGWAQILVMLRNILILPFGLRGDGPDTGDKVGFFPVETEVDDELIAGFNDRHLNFRVSVISRDGHVYLATWVHRHNLLGRAYLATIMPFHILIAKDALARVARHG